MTQKCSGTGIYRVNPASNKAEMVSSITTLIGNDFIRSIADDGKGSLWFSTNSLGLIRMNKSTGELSFYQKSRENLSLPSNHLEAIYADKDILWIGTGSKGPVLAVGGTSFTSRSVFPETERITSVLEDTNGNVWVGFDGMGVRRINKDGSQTLYNTSNSNIPSNSIIGIFLHEGRVWLFSYGGGLFWYDGQKFVSHEAVASHPELSQCQTCLVDDLGNLWISTFNKGVFRLPLAAKANGVIGKIKSLPTDNITAMAYSSKDRRAYVGTAIGAFAVESDGKITTVAKDTHVLCMLVDRQGRLWIGTNDGLDCFDRQEKHVATYSFADGLASSHIKSLALNNAGNIWVGCVGGLSCVSLDAKGEVESVKTYLHNDVRMTYDFYRNAVSCCRNGDIIFASDDDFMRMSMNSMNGKAEDYVVSFTSYNVAGNYKGTLIGRETLRIGYNERTFSINVTTFTYNPDKAITYRYRTNSSQPWTIISGNSISFTELAPGNYDVEVEAKDMSGNFGKTSVLHISVAQPWWWSMWAKMLYLLVLVSALSAYLIYIRKRYTKKMATQRQELEEKGRQDVEDARMQILTNVIDEGLLLKVNQAVMEHIGNAEYSVMDLARDLGISHSGLYKKLMSITKKSPLEYMHLIRLKRGKEIIDAGETTVSQVAYQVGLSPKQFSKYFKQVYGMLPSEYLASSKATE